MGVLFRPLIYLDTFRQKGIFDPEWLHQSCLPS
jgi:hypothetical protein